MIRRDWLNITFFLCNALTWLPIRAVAECRVPCSMCSVLYPGIFEAIAVLQTPSELEGMQKACSSCKVTQCLSVTNRWRPTGAATA